MLRLEDGPLAIWTVCRNPSDFPGMFTARRSLVMAGGVIRPDADCWVERSVTPIRRRMLRLGLTRLPPSPDDDPAIFEVWL